MKVKVTRHAADRLRYRMPNGRRFNTGEAVAWIKHRVAEAVSAAECLRIVDRNENYRTVVDLGQNVSAVIREEGAQTRAVLTVLSNEMVQKSLARLGEWQLQEGYEPGSRPKTVVSWVEGKGFERTTIVLTAMLEEKKKNLIRGGVNPATIQTKPYEQETYIQRPHQFSNKIGQAVSFKGCNPLYRSNHTRA